MSDPEYVILGLPCGKPPTVPGSVKAPCAACGTEVWLTPASQKKLGDGKGAVICPSCVPDSVCEVSVMKESMVELLHHLRRN